MNTSSSNQNLYFGASSEITNPVTHSALDFFEGPSVLINYEGSFDQEVFPHVGCRGPQLDSFVTSGNKNCIDLNRICLGLDVKLYNPDEKDAATPDNLLFSNNTLHSLFSDIEIFLNGKLITISNNNFHHAAFVGTELSTDPVSQRTWTVYQGYRYRPNREKNLEVKNKIMKKFADYGACSLYLYGAPHVDFLDCERLLLPGVTLHLHLYRSPIFCALENLTDLDADAVKSLDKNPPVVVIEKASLFVNKIVLSDTVKLSIERALTKSSAVYPYIENSTKIFIIQSGQNCFVKENIFGTEHFRRLTMCMVRNRFFRGATTASTPFSYEKFDLQKVELLRGNGLPIAGTPLNTSNDTRLFYNVITALGFERGGNGVALEDYQDNHFYLVFDLTSTTEASKSLTLFPELTGAGITLKVSFSNALPEAVELFLIGERISQIFIQILEKFQRIRRWSMDNFSLFQLADNCCPKLFKKFIGVASSDNFFSGRDFEEILNSAVTTGQKFFYQIVNSAAETEAGQHWLLL